MNDYNKLLNNFDVLKLDKMKDYYPNFIESAKNKSITECLLELTNKEIEYRNERASQIQITVSAFPYKKEKIIICTEVLINDFFIFFYIK